VTAKAIIDKDKQNLCQSIAVFFKTFRQKFLSNGESMRIYSLHVFEHYQVESFDEKLNKQAAISIWIPYQNNDLSAFYILRSINLYV
jgi:hypothetical protein